MKKKKIFDEIILYFIFFLIFLRFIFDGLTYPLFNLIFTLFIFFIFFLFVLKNFSKVKIELSEIFLLFFLIISIFSSFFSEIKGTGIRFNSYIATYLSFYILLKNLIREKNRLEVFLLFYLFSIFFICIYGIYQRFWGFEETRKFLLENYKFLMSQHPEFAKYFTPTFFHRLESNRVFSTFAYPNIYAGFLITILPFLYFIFLDNIDFKNLRLIRFFSLFLIFLCIINLYFTESVGGFFVLLFVFHIIFLNFLFGPKKFKKILPLLIFFEILFFYLGYKFGKLPHIHSFVDRVYYWKATWKMILYKPILGIGAENFQYYFPKYKLPEGLEVKHAHNLFFETAAETGFLGISLLFIFLVMVILKGFKNEKFRNFNFGISYSLISFLLHNFVDFDFSDPSLAIIFFILGAIIYSKEKEIKQRLTKMVLCFIIILNILCFVTLLRYEISEEICRKRYAVKEKSLEAKIYYLNLAESWYNKNFEIYIDRSDVYINIWRVKENTEYLEKGISDLLKAVYLNPYLIKGFKRLASIYENLGNFEKAEKFYLKLIEIYPNKKLYNLEVARFYKKYGKEKEFKYFYEKSKNLKGVNIEEGILIDEIEKWIESQK